MPESKLVRKLIERAVKCEEFAEFDVNIEGKTGKSDGYIGNVTFVSVSGKDENGTPKKVDLVVKTSKESTNLRNQVPIKEANEQEIFIYDKVVKEFTKFQQERNIATIIQVTPHCYATESTGERECLLLENLKSKGYRLVDRKVPMSFSNMKLVLEAYGKWHALSLALKNKKPEVFSKLSEESRNMFSEWIVKAQMVDFIWDTFNKSKKILFQTNNMKILEMLDFSRDEVEFILSDLFFEDPDHQVILHGDGWTNNFLFKFEKNSSKAVDVAILDYQCSGIGSPVFDLSYFLYSSCATENYEDFEKLLKIYHNSLSKQLQILGCKAEEVFSFAKLLDHWKRFSRYGIVMMAFILRFVLCEEEDAPDFNTAAEKGMTFLECFNFIVKNEDQYFERVTNNLLHHAYTVHKL